MRALCLRKAPFALCISWPWGLDLRSTLPHPKSVNIQLAFRRSTSTLVYRYTGLAAPQPTPYTARTACRRHHYEVTELIGACGDCGFRRSKSACEMRVEIALITGMLDGLED